MRYTVIEAAKIVGKSRQTIYRHIEKKPITTEKDDDGNVYIDASELLRVYGDNINFDAVNSNIAVPKNGLTLQVETSKKTISDLNILEEKLNSSNKQIEMLEARMRSEREMLEGQIDTIKDALEKSQEVQSKTVALLEDKSNSSGAGTIHQSLSDLKARMDKQEQAARDEAAKKEEMIQQEKEHTDRALSEKQDYQKTTKLLYAFTAFLILIFIAGFILYTQGTIDITH